MKIVNRGFIFLKHRQPFWDWANQFESEIQFSEKDDCEGSIYLIEEDFMEADLVLEQNFKKIFHHELILIADEESFPENMNIELFLEWFYVDFGTGVYDLQKLNLISEKID